MLKEFLSIGICCMLGSSMVVLATLVVLGKAFTLQAGNIIFFIVWALSWWLSWILKGKGV